MEQPPNKQKHNMGIVGINIIVMLVYVMFCLATGNSGLMAMWLIMLAHVGIGFITAFICALIPEYRMRSLPWVLSSVVILLIGLSTCYMAVSGNLGHM